MAKKRNEKAQEPPESLWVRYNQQPGQPYTPHTIGPFGTSTNPMVKISLNPGEWTEVNGEWALILSKSHLAHMFDFADRRPE